MSEKRLVLNMLAEGKISQEEAEQLLEAMGEIVDLEPARATETEEALEEFLKASDKLDAENRIEEDDLKEFESLSDTADDLNWLYIKVFAGNINIKGDDSMSEPKIILGDKYRLSQVNDVFVLRPIKENKKSGSFIDGIVNFVDNLGSNMAGNLEILLPKGFGVKLKSSAGDVKVKNIEYFSAKMMAGNVKAKNISGISLNNAAGDIKVSVLAGAYDNRIKAAAGNVDLTLLAGSNAKLRAKVSVGELSHEGLDFAKDVEIKSALIGSELSAIVGDGSRDFDIRLSAGNLEIEVEK